VFADEIVLPLIAAAAASAAAIDLDIEFVLRMSKLGLFVANVEVPFPFVLAVPLTALVDEMDMEAMRSKQLRQSV
jgi:hypothetical protein